MPPFFNSDWYAWLRDKFRRRPAWDEGMGEGILTPLASPKLNACQEFGKLAARLHATKFLGGLDITNCTFEPDGKLKSMFSIGRGSIQEHVLTIEERLGDLAVVKKQLGTPDEWEAFKLGYRFGAPREAQEVLTHIEPSTSEP